MTRKSRADTALVERGFFESRAKAQEAIAAGLVSVEGVLVRKASEPVSSASALRAEAPYPWVSRGGLKLSAAFAAFGFDPQGCEALDIGASTGGFTDVLITLGAARVHAVDVGHGQLHPRLRANPRIVSLEGRDARGLTEADLPTPPAIVTFDVSFIPLRLVLAPVLALAAAKADLIALIKPQFEAGRDRVRKGIVRDPAVHADVCQSVEQTIRSLGWTVMDIVPSPVQGGDGNREFLIGARRG